MAGNLNEGRRKPDNEERKKGDPLEAEQSECSFSKHERHHDQRDSLGVVELEGFVAFLIYKMEAWIVEKLDDPDQDHKGDRKKKFESLHGLSLIFNRSGRKGV